MSEIDVVVIGGEAFTPHDITQMTPAQFAEFVEWEEELYQDYRDEQDQARRPM